MLKFSSIKFLCNTSHRWFLTFLFLFISASTPYVYAETIHVVTENLEPDQFKRQDGTIDGFSTEVINALFEITGDTADIEMMTWARAYDLARSKKTH